ncbi:MAG: methyltransferase [Blastocatellia bacterium]|nr:methyltransferase [Blastocatellia bacterium]
MKEQLPPETQLMQTLGACFISQAAYVAAKLGIADLLAESPKPVAELAAASETDERSLYRVLRTLAMTGIFRETEKKVFENTPVSETLRSSVPNSLREMAIWLGEEPHWRVYGEMLYSVRTGKAAWKHVHGQDVFPHLFETDRELGDIFNRAMTSYSSTTIPAIVEAYDFSGVGVLADVAGGYGHLLAAVLKEYPKMKGVLFDLPFVLEGAPALLEKEGVADRVELVRGDFCDRVPVTADVYLLKHVIHDWYDEKNTTILKNIRASMPDDGRILIIDAVVPEGNEHHFGKVIDLEMLVSPGGVERTESEFRELLAASGLKLNRVTPTRSIISIVEAVKAN